MAQPFRLVSGGLIDRTLPLDFTFNGRSLVGFEGDTLAAALLANGIDVVGRSFKYHRPRGIVCAGPDEPNALVQVGRGARTTPNIRATQLDLCDGLFAESQNCWPSVDFDVGVVANYLSWMLPAGFYYKTFKWPPSFWKMYERVIRRMAGMGRAPDLPDPDYYEHRSAHCDVLVVGGGPAGLCAASAAGQAGARVLLVDEGSLLGGSLLFERLAIDESPALNWVRQTVETLQQLPNVVLLSRSTAFAFCDHNAIGVLESIPPRKSTAPRQRVWKIRAKQVVLATGAFERPLLFGNNDRPGVMLASATRAYINRFAVKPGARAVLFANNDAAYATALDLHRSGIKVLAVVDPRNGEPGSVPRSVANLGIACYRGAAITKAIGRRRVVAVEIAVGGGGDVLSGRSLTIACDLVCTSGGWSPAVHLHSQAKGKLRLDQRIAAFVPDECPPSTRSAGASNGALTLSRCLDEGLAAGAAAASAVGFGKGKHPPSHDATNEPDDRPGPIIMVAPKGSKCFVDLQNDVTISDIALAVREGYTSIEHLKRYTTLGMGTDQGKLSNINGVAMLAQLLNVDPSKIGTTTFRPPYTPVTFGAMAAFGTCAALDPVRLTPLHSWHAEAGASFVNVGLWRRPRCYVRPGESDRDAVKREVTTVRNHAGLADISTIGKIDVKGVDAQSFLERLYPSASGAMAVGEVRDGTIVREDGIVYDEGRVMRLGLDHYLVTTTTANADAVLTTLEYYLQVHWPSLDVRLTSVTEHWATIVLVGPNARSVLEAVEPRQDWSNRALPYMFCRISSIKDSAALICRTSFSGELSYEIYVPAEDASDVWKSLLSAGQGRELAPHGTEAIAVMRIEKGRVGGMELDGRTSPIDLAMIECSEHSDFVGKRSLARSAMCASDRKQLVGLCPLDHKSMIPRGSQLVADPRARTPIPILGHVTSTCWSPTIDRPIGLALVARNCAGLGNRLWAMAPLEGVSVPVEVTDPIFVDPNGDRPRA